MCQRRRLLRNINAFTGNIEWYQYLPFDAAVVSWTFSVSSNRRKYKREAGSANKLIGRLFHEEDGLWSIFEMEVTIRGVSQQNLYAAILKAYPAIQVSGQFPLSGNFTDAFAQFREFFFARPADCFHTNVDIWFLNKQWLWHIFRIESPRCIKRPEARQAYTSRIELLIAALLAAAMSVNGNEDDDFIGDQRSVPG